MQQETAQPRIAKSINAIMLDQPIQYDIWNKKYRFNNEANIDATWWRIANALAMAEPVEKRMQYASEFHSALQGFRFIPAGRIISWAGTGRSTTHNNCLGGDERFYSLERGLCSLKETVGQKLSVWTKDGWKLARVQNFGKQPLNKITLTPTHNSACGWSPGKTKFARTIRATPDHAWILADGRRTTKLATGDLVESCAGESSAAYAFNPTFSNGFCHGLIFADGCHIEERRIDRYHLHTIHLCGGKADHIWHFERGTHKTTVASTQGDPILQYSCDRNCKELPAAEDGIDYISGFINGWIAADGSDIGPGRHVLSTQDTSAAEWIKSYAPLAGFIFVGSSEGFENRQNLRFRKEDKVKWRVVNIKPLDEDEVFCATLEDETIGAFTLEGGVYTGNCFVMGEIPDDMGGIFAALRESALTMQQGGGIGMNFSTLRPNGAHVHGVDAEASGPLPFMDTWDAMCKTIMSAGSRRGAMMAVLDVSHPDIEAFIEAKREPGRLRNFNVSVAVSDAFMQAVKNDDAWMLHFNGENYRSVAARELWNKILRGAYDCAEPGVVFMDRYNALNTLSYCEKINATNPCGEQGLPSYGACLLGSINLAALVQRPFESGGFNFKSRTGIDRQELTQLVTTAVRMLDNCIDVGNYPLKKQLEEANLKRRIGLGITGLGDALAMCQLHYASEEARKQAGKWMQIINEAAIEASMRLACEKGAFPLYAQNRYPYNMQIAAKVNDFAGMRNSHVTSIAPTGTISLLAGNVSSGIEPIFDLAYERKVLDAEGGRDAYSVEDYAYRLWKQMNKSDLPLPHYLATATAHDISPADHLAMQAAMQKYVDSSISKTINCSASMPFEEFGDIYMQAYALGLKGCTAYRPNEITGSVLDRKSDLDAAQELTDRLTEEKSDTLSKIEAEAQRYAADVIAKAKAGAPRRRKREEVMFGRTYKFRWAHDTIYVTINDIDEVSLQQNGNGVVEATVTKRPYEIFIRSKKPDANSWTTALALMISAVWQYDGNADFVAEELRAVFDPKGGTWMHGKYVPSLIAAIGDVIARHCADLAVEDAGPPRVSFEEAAEQGGALATECARPTLFCARCGSSNCVREEGCTKCRVCSYSNCG